MTIVKLIESYLNTAHIVRGTCFVRQIDKGIESKNYLISINDKNNYKYILKIYSKSNIEELRYEIEILNKLNSGVREKYFPVVQKEVFYIDKKPSVLLNYIPGRILVKKDVTSSLIKKIAKKQAEMHYLFTNCIPRHKKVRFSIFDLNFFDLYVKKENPYYNILHNEISILQRESELFANIHFQKSIIHEDLSLENIIINRSGDINFIDFGESHRAEIISDIAIAIKEIIISNVGVDINLIKDYLGSYKKVICLSKDEISTLLFLLKRRTVFMIAYFLHKQETGEGITFKKRIESELKVLKSLQKNISLIRDFIKEYQYE